jgi:hypothetical protein
MHEMCHKIVVSNDYMLHVILFCILYLKSIICRSSDILSDLFAPIPNTSQGACGIHGGFLETSLTVT